MASRAPHRWSLWAFVYVVMANLLAFGILTGVGLQDVFADTVTATTTATTAATGGGGESPSTDDRPRTDIGWTNFRRLLLRFVVGAVTGLVMVGLYTRSSRRDM